MENHDISNRLSNHVKKHLHNHFRVFRRDRDREPSRILIRTLERLRSRILIRTLERLRTKNSKVTEFTHKGIRSYTRKSS